MKLIFYLLYPIRILFAFSYLAYGIIRGAYLYIKYGEKRSKEILENELKNTLKGVYK